MFRLKEHVSRMFESAKIYLMKMPYSPREVEDAVKTTVNANKLEECYLRPLAYYGAGDGTKPTPEQGEP